VRRAQQFVYGLADLKLREVDATYLDNYLDVLGRNASLQDWQGRQPLELAKKTRRATKTEQGFAFVIFVFFVANNAPVFPMFGNEKGF